MERRAQGRREEMRHAVVVALGPDAVYLHVGDIGRLPFEIKPVFDKGIEIVVEVFSVHGEELSLHRASSGHLPSFNACKEVGKVKFDLLLHRLLPREGTLGIPDEMPFGMQENRV